ncbi:MAG: hypothetical protein J7J06_08025 [Methanosarcinales archaeon]|nr:hypothetical protein [Methanosarcinales archaeon]
MNRTLKLAVPLLLLAVLCTALSGASTQQVAIKADDGGDLPESIRVGETFTALITEGGSPVPAGTNVVFTLPASGGTPIFVPTDSDGKARYKPLITGTLKIRVLDGTTTVAEATVAVEEVPVEIVGWTLDETAARGTYIDATVTIKNIGTRPLWFVVSVSGIDATTGYPLIGISAVRLDASESVDMPVKIAAPSFADVGEYTLTPIVYRLDDYPTGDPEAIGSGKSVTIS